MKRYLIRCTQCANTEVYGSTEPVNVEACGTARMMRAQCRDMGCKFKAMEAECKPDEVDLLRLGMREERVIA